MQNLPLLEPGNFYHIYNRGNNGENIFIEARNYGYFLDLYQKYIPPVADTFVYCLLKNHFHFLVRIKDTQESKGLNPANQFSKLFNAYAKSVNKAYHRTGSLFEKRFRRKIVSSDKYFGHLVCYIHANPKKHKIQEDYHDYPYSSLPVLLSNESTFLSRDQVFEWFGGREIFISVHQEEIDEKNIFAYIDNDLDYR